ncbi:MAG: hypothetical protein ABJB49_07160 [Nitrospirota bacterium]
MKAVFFLTRRAWWITLAVMLNKISCSAATLEQLTPASIRSVVGAETYDVGSQYFSENLVQIFSAENGSILSQVKGLNGTYKQNISLEHGKLATSCSCSSKEQPFCRHCTAVLLQWHSQGAARTKSVEKPVKRQTPDPALALSATLREFCSFIEWLNLASEDLHLGRPLPDAPSLDSPELLRCFKVIHELQGRMIRSDETCAVREDELAARGKQMEQLTLQLQSAVAESRETRTTAEEIQRDLQRTRKRLSAMEGSQGQLGTKLVALVDAMSSKGLELTQLAAAVKELTSALQTNSSADSDSDLADPPVQ